MNNGSKHHSKNALVILEDYCILARFKHMRVVKTLQEIVIVAVIVLLVRNTLTCLPIHLSSMHSLTPLRLRVSQQDNQFSSAIDVIIPVKKKLSSNTRKFDNEPEIREYYPPFLSSIHCQTG